MFRGETFKMLHLLNRDSGWRLSCFLFKYYCTLFYLFLISVPSIWDIQFGKKVSFHVCMQARTTRQRKKHSQQKSIWKCIQWKKPQFPQGALPRYNSNMLAIVSFLKNHIQIDKDKTNRNDDLLYKISDKNWNNLKYLYF